MFSCALRLEDHLGQSSQILEYSSREEESPSTRSVIWTTGHCQIRGFEEKVKGHCGRMQRFCSLASPSDTDAHSTEIYSDY